jgi:hypothetical protein
MTFNDLLLGVGIWFLLGLLIGYGLGYWQKSYEVRREKKRQAEIDSAVKAAMDREKKSGDQ